MYMQCNVFNNVFKSELAHRTKKSILLAVKTKKKKMFVGIFLDNKNPNKKSCALGDILATFKQI